MTKKEILENNKEEIECLLACYELECSELLDILGNFPIILSEFLCCLEENFEKDGFTFEHEKLI